MRRISIPFFRIFYSSTYTVLLLILFVLLAATPGDHIYQTISHGKIGNVFVVAGVYIVTALIAIFIYASRLYTNRVALAAIPRWYLPIEKDELSKGVYRLITKNRQRSAIIAWDTRPRDLTAELQTTHLQNHSNLHGSSDLRPSVDTSHSHLITSKSKHDTVFPVNPSLPPWGRLSHPGWSSPSSPDLPNLYFASVVTELPHLLEAKAVSIAPADPAYSPLSFQQNNDGFEIPPDPIIVATLQRPPKAGLRAYLAHLSELGVASDAGITARFVRLYEAARFSDTPITETAFRELMSVFSDLLVSLIPLTEDVVREIHEEHTRGMDSMEKEWRREGSVRSEESTGSVAHYDVGDW